MEAESVGIVDFGFIGTLSYYLQKLLPEKQLVTYYFNGDISEENELVQDGVFKVCFQAEDDSWCNKSLFRKYSVQNEAVYTAPYGMMERIERQTIVYQEDAKRDFEINKKINAGIKRFIKDISRYQLNVEKKQCLFMDELFGYLSEVMQVTEEMEHGLKHTDSWSGYT